MGRGRNFVNYVNKGNPVIIGRWIWDRQLSTSKLCGAIILPYSYSAVMEKNWGKVITEFKFTCLVFGTLLAYVYSNLFKFWYEILAFLLKPPHYILSKPCSYFLLSKRDKIDAILDQPHLYSKEIKLIYFLQGTKIICTCNTIPQRENTQIIT